MTASEARQWADTEGTSDGLRHLAGSAPAIPEAAGDLLRRLSLPVPGAYASPGTGPMGTAA